MQYRRSLIALILTATSDFLMSSDGSNRAQVA